MRPQQLNREEVPTKATSSPELSANSKEEAAETHSKDLPSKNPPPYVNGAIESSPMEGLEPCNQMDSNEHIGPSEQSGPSEKEDHVFFLILKLWAGNPSGKEKPTRSQIQPIKAP
ncbi:hypothetical protein ACOSP7_022177 [Xanthoceras sorbifolium]